MYSFGQEVDSDRIHDGWYRFLLFALWLSCGISGKFLCALGNIASQEMEIYGVERLGVIGLTLGGF